MISTVFFDAGETLLHPYPSFHELFSVVCRDRGHDVSPERVLEVQNALAPHLVDLADEAEEVHRGTSYTGSSFSADESRRFWTGLYRRFLVELGIDEEELAVALFETFSDSSSYRLFDDAMPVLLQLQELGYRLGLISNFEEWLEEMLVELEVGHIFSTRVISGVEGVEKPDPAIYRLALERAGVTADHALHVGDSPSMDIEPAAEVGIRGVLLDRAGRYGGAECLSIRSLKELPDLLTKV